MAMSWNGKINGLIGKLNYTVMIVLLGHLSPINSHAATQEGEMANTVATAESSGTHAVVDMEKRRALMEKAIHEEKIRMRTDIRDSNNERRGAGEILGFDVFLGGFLTALWSLISLFFASRFFSKDQEAAEFEGRSGAKVFYASASLMPLLLLWVAISTGHVSWWVAFAMSASTYWLIGKLLMGIRNSIAKQALPA